MRCLLKTSGPLADNMTDRRELHYIFQDRQAATVFSLAKTNKGRRLSGHATLSIDKQTKMWFFLPQRFKCPTMAINKLTKVYLSVPSEQYDSPASVTKVRVNTKTPAK